ncbi:MAG TPA: M36 family metallopeptidase, partial [Pyrinomonadaceae bacterium]
ANRVFNFNYNPAPGNPAPGDDPLAANSQKGGVTNLFYIVNRYHDELYRLGFTEQAGNFQHDNFGRGGLGNDRISAQSQDNFCPNSTGCVNNANFGTGVDGVRGRMQMFLWTAANPDRDGSLDAEIVIHELTHGLSNRLHGNALGLTSNMSDGMGEGWGDFYAHALLSEPTDPLNGVYTTGGYDTYLGAGGAFTGNYFYGIRRFPKALMSATGGPNNQPFNPLTFADADATQYNTSDGAFPRGPFGSSTVDQVHNLGEIWSSMLWEVRGKFIARLGWETGNRRVLQYVTDGMKLAPSSPTMIQERDAIIAAAQASLSAPQANADVADIWEGFRIRGMGFNAKVINAGSGSGDTRVVEAFDAPNLLQTPAITVSDSTGDNDGFPEPGEKILLNLPLNNNTGANAANVTAQIAGGETKNFGTITNNSTAAQQIGYTIPAGTACGSSIALTINVNSSLGAIAFTHHIVVGVEKITFTENFDNISVPALPTGWTTSTVGGGVNFVTNAGNFDSAPNSAFVSNPEVKGESDLISPPTPIASQAAVLSFRNHYATEEDWDGGVLEIKVGNGEFQDIIAAGGRFIEGGYNGSLGTGSALENRAAWTGISGGYLTTKVQLPAAAQGQNVQFRWRFGSDSNTAVTGWNIDTIRLAGNYTCGTVDPTAVKSRADFDGDGRTDMSVFRPANGNWFLNRSRDGFSAVQFGLASDKLVPGDYDGDNKTDVAVYRNGAWFILKSSDNSFQAIGFGFSSDIVVPGDYDGDGKTDAAVFRPSNNTWYALNSSGGGVMTAGFGAAGDVPVTGDFDGDGKADLTVFRRGQWITQLSSGAVTFTSWGLPSDRPVAADYDGDNKDDVAVYRPETGAWYVYKSTNQSLYAVGFGAPGDVAVPGDYDGDGRDDVAVFRSGTWFISGSASGFSAAGFGVAADVPAPSAYIPPQ